MNEKTNRALEWLLARGSESSTWRGLILAVAGIIGWELSTSKAEAITNAGIAIVGVINIFRQGSPTKSQVADALETKQDK